jgi:hypothetical protein
MRRKWQYYYPGVCLQLTVRIVGVPTEIRSKHLANTNQPVRQQQLKESA